MIEVTGLRKRYGRTLAVDGLTFAVRPGVVTGFLGPNGAGKSTTMRVILGLDRPTSGSVRVNGQPPGRHKAPLAEIGALLDAKAASVRTWLYRIATNVCLSALERRGRRPPQVNRAGQSTAWPYPEPIPDRLLAARAEAVQPDDGLVERETVELTFLAALHVLSPRQRAAFILRDVLGLPASEAAEALDLSVAATKSALQRARATLRDALSEDRMKWPAARATPSDAWAITKRYVTAIEQRDSRAMAELLHNELRVRYLPRGLEVNGSSAFIEGSERHAPIGEFRYIETAANGQPAIGVYLRPPGADEFGRLSLTVLRVAGERIVEIIDFSAPRTLDAFGLPASSPP